MTESATATPSRLQFNLRFKDAAERDAWHEKAAGAGVSLSDYIRHFMTTGKAPKPKPAPAYRSADAATIDRLDDLGGLVNSYARNVNAGRDYTPADILRTLAALLALVKGDEALAPLFTEAGQAARLAPLAPAQYAALSRIANNLSQIAEGVAFGDFMEQARTAAAFAGLWRRAVAAELSNQGRR